MSDLERPLPEEHEAHLKRILGLGEESELPEDTRKLYWDVARTARALGSPMTDHELILILTLLNRPAQESPVSFLDTIKEKKLKAGERVVAKWRNEWKLGRYQGHKGKTVYVQFDDDTAEVRNIGPTVVRLATRDDIEKVGA